MKNPLVKRLPRELKEEFGKYLVIFVFLAGVIAIVSGFLVASDSMIHAYDESFERYHIEDGNFELANEATDDLIELLEKEKLSIYRNYYVEEKTSEVDSMLRIFINREEINLVCVMSGELPSNDTQIAIDRMYADNNKLHVGDTLTVGGKNLTISGFVALSDYSAMFSNNSDLMFDATKFGVSVMTKEGFEAFGDTHLHYSYSWIYDQPPKNENDAKKMSEDFLQTLDQNAMIIDYVPEYCNQAIHFAGDDLGKDSAMFIAFLYIIILIIAFVMAITTSNTISKESTVIGTLRASGYTKGEIIRHYLTMPLLVMLIAALIGNILGYTLLKNYIADMYYSSYSLPTYVTIWKFDALIKTTVIPVIIMFLINVILLARKMSISPLRFIRRDLSKRSRKKAFRLNEKIPFMKRFRIRIILQNLPNYITIFIGVLLANFILLFGFMFHPLLEHMQEEIISHMICENQYVLKAQVETKDQTAEKYCVVGLKTVEGKHGSEEVTAYGVDSDSDYVKIEFQGEGVYISEAYSDKYHVKIGDTITLEKEYEDSSYDFLVEGIYSYPTTIAIFMERTKFNQIFDMEEDYYNGYFSNRELDDIDDIFVATTITLDDMTKTSRQLKVSLGNMMNLFLAFGVIIFMLIIYLLSKIIIEKNANSISMVKIIGYDVHEINRLYVTATTIVVVLSLIVTIPMCYYVMGELVVILFKDFSGWFPYYVPGITFVKMILLGIGSYAVVAFVQMRKIKKIPMSDALKNVE